VNLPIPGVLGRLGRRLPEEHLRLLLVLQILLLWQPARLLLLLWHLVNLVLLLVQVW
jgi:hypothetical protein